MISTSYEEQDLNNAFAPPSLTHLFGTDNLGRDLLAVFFMEEEYPAVGFLATAVSLLIGVSYGMASGYLGGKIDALMMRVVDILYSLPFTIFVILLMVLFGRNFILLFIAIGAVEWLTMARITRGQTLSLKQAEFIEAARALGFRLKNFNTSHFTKFTRTSHCLRNFNRTNRYASGGSSELSWRACKHP